MDAPQQIGEYFWPMLLRNGRSLDLSHNNLTFSLAFSKAFCGHILLGKIAYSTLPISKPIMQAIE
ncbi:MAG: hypothetical protein J7647_11095 [Cyanobacteria bacterium SBLK]|nr:hypothetical protein [Cyanobacteria bacterium SBLK]